MSLHSEHSPKSVRDIHAMENTCRLCLNETSDSLEDMWEGCDVLNKLSTCLSHYISLSEDLPRKVCYQCVKTVEDIYTFYNKISQNENLLLQRTNKFSDNSLYVKEDHESSGNNIHELVLYETSKYEEPFVAELEVKNEIDEENPLNEEVVGEETEIKSEVHKDSDYSLCNKENPLNEETPAQETEIKSDIHEDPDSLLSSNIRSEIKVIIKKKKNGITKENDNRNKNDTKSFAKDNRIRNEIKETFKKKKDMVKKGNKIKSEAEKIDVDKKENLNINNLNEPVNKTNDDIIPMSILKEKKPEIINDSNSFTKKYTCLTCFEVFTNQLELTKHYRNIELEKFNKNNMETNNKIQDDTAKYKIVKEPDGSLTYKCERCYKKYRLKKFIERHVDSHSERRPYLCKLCGKTYQTATIIVAHGKMHTGEMYSCSYRCGYQSVHKHVVTDHEKRHRKEYKYTCETCGKGFQVRTWYEQHQNIHNDVRPFRCDQCHKTFHLHKYLMVHKSSVHPQSSGQKPWVCKHCDAPCDSKTSLNLHLKQTHGIVTSQATLCDICGKVVKDAQRLLRHKRTAHLNIIVKPHSCSFCNKCFQKKYSLKVHEQTHTGKRYVCDLCERTFTRSDTLVRHMKTHNNSKNKCLKCDTMFESKLKMSAHQKICKSVTIEYPNSD